MNSVFQSGPARGGFRGYIVPGPGPRGPGRVQVSALSLGIAPRGVFRPAPNLGKIMGLNLSEALFFIACHLVLGKKLDQI